jgi:hypothetical protein
MSVQRVTITSVIVDYIHSLDKRVTDEFKRVDVQLSNLKRMLIVLTITSNVPTLQALGLHTTDLIPNITRLILGWIHL